MRTYNVIKAAECLGRRKGLERQRDDLKQHIGHDPEVTVTYKNQGSVVDNERFKVTTFIGPEWVRVLISGIEAELKVVNQVLEDLGVED